MHIPRYELDAAVVAHELLIAQEFEIVFHAPPIAAVARPGQFLQLLFGENYAPLVRRPFSIYRADPETGTVSIFYRARGSFTSALAQKRPGDVVSLLGPLGSPYQWTETENVRHILIAGGIGAPPITFLARELCRNAVPDTVVVLNAARTQDYLVGMSEFRNLPVVLHAITEDGSEGRQGVVTEVLHEMLDADGRETRLYGCGPMPMLRAIADIALLLNLSCQVSVETSMPCGTGVCYGCMIPVQSETDADFTYARACYEGPVFEASRLVWK